MLVVVSGLPGVGKSTLAGALGAAVGAPVLAVDPIEAAMRRAGIEASHECGVAAYEVAATLAEAHLRLGLDVVVDAVSAAEAARARWRQVARATGSDLAVVVVECSEEAVHRARLAGRRRDLPGLPEPTWPDVELARAQWQPWPDWHLVLDAVDEPSVNLAAALAHVRP